MLAIHEHEATIDSREVAGMVGKQHKDLLRDIRGYVEALTKATERKIAPSDFFIDSTYNDSTGRMLPCYLVTRKGCEMVANKMTGERGVVFTAAYINRFHEMEAGAVPKSLPEALRLAADLAEKNSELQIELDRNKEWYSIKRVAALNGISWKRFDWRKLKTESINRGIDARKIFDANYGEVNVYHQSVWEAVYPQYEL